MTRPALSIGFLLILIAIIIFAFAAAGVAISGVSLVPLGLAFFAAGHIL